MVLKYLQFLFLGVLLNISICDSYNILVIFGHPGKSHYDAFSALFLELAEKGHNLTILSHVPVKPTKNIKQLLLRDTEPLRHVMNLHNTGQHRFADYYSQPILIQEFAKENCRRDLQTARFQNFLKDENQFDLIIGEMFNTNCYEGLVNKYKAPFIGLSSCALLSWQAEWFGIPYNPSYIQNLFAGFKAPMSFLSRVENSLFTLYINIWHELTISKQGRELSEKYTGYAPADPYNASLLFVNTHYTLDGVKPLTPNVIEVGGIHINNREAKKLPEDIESWINNSHAGVIYFSLGSMIKGTTFPEKQRRAFARAFAKLPQRILWKWENDTMLDKPDNVMIGKWMPQFDILSHPNVKLFITHGGNLGATEAVHCGVPMIVMPQFGDQRHNAHAIENNGVGVVLHLQSATEETIFEALKKALDPQVLLNAKSLSEKFRDRPLPPMETAVYWVEHVARHKGALHMRSQAIDLPFYQYFLLDVIAFVLIVFLTLLFSFYKIVRLILGLIISSPKMSKEKRS